MPDNLDALRHIEGFPIGEDEDLVALSDPPHYTAYPNPHIADFITKWGTPYDEATDDYHREPYVSDVSEGKNDPVYNAHSYHTKVPYKAIIPFIEHYTQPGDIVFDGFCGTGMTGVAAQMVGRRAILCDLSPVATYIAHNYNAPIDVPAFEREARRILREVEAECGWMYETWHPHCDAPNRIRGRINYTVWSDVFLCPYCGTEIVFWDAAVDEDQGEVLDHFPCPGCQARVTKRELIRATECVTDRALGKQIERARHAPVVINYSVGTRRYEKKPDTADLALIQRIEESEIPHWHPTSRMPEGDEARRNDPIGMTHVHHFFARKEMWALAALWSAIERTSDRRARFALRMPFTTMLLYCSFMRRFRPDRRGGGPLSGTLYVSSISTPLNPCESYRRNCDSAMEAFGLLAAKRSPAGAITTQSATALSASPESSVGYIFTDPPFGSNLMYSELNFLWEAWLRVFTNNGPEAIISKLQRKELEDYRELMTRCFAEMYRVLKPGRWITVVFHNSRASVWNAIQEALAHAGFLVAQVTVLDKQQETFKQVTSPGSVQNDLVINAYKPRAGFSRRFLSQAGRGLEPEFVLQHLAQLPVAANVERSREMLYSKYLAYYVQHGYHVAYNGEQFYRALPQWGLEERDGYWFADEVQVNEYERRKIGARKAASAQAVLFVSDERSARQWLWGFLDAPKTYDEIYTAFVKALQTPEDQIPELKSMLGEGFVQTDGRWKRPDALTGTELESRRQARLLRQFEEYLATARGGGRLREVRKEALVAGFTEAYRAGRFQDILTVGRRLDRRLLEESPDLFDFVDISEAKVEG
jgi:DNA modification methylase